MSEDTSTRHVVPPAFASALASLAKATAAAPLDILTEAVLMAPDGLLLNEAPLDEPPVPIEVPAPLAAVIEDMAASFGMTLPGFYLYMSRYLHKAAAATIVHTNEELARGLRKGDAA